MVTKKQRSCCYSYSFNKSHKLDFSRHVEIGHMLKWLELKPRWFLINAGVYPKRLWFFLDAKKEKKGFFFCIWLYWTISVDKQQSISREGKVDGPLSLGRSSSLDRCILAIQHTPTASPTALNQHPRTDCHLSNSQNCELLINFPSINPKFARISDAKSINRIPHSKQMCLNEMNQHHLKLSAVVLTFLYCNLFIT